MSKGRPIGEKIRLVCETLERIGPASRLQIHEHLPDMQPEYISDNCKKATNFGFMTAEKVKGTTTQHSHWNVWTVKPNWRQLMDEPWQHLKPIQSAQKSTWSGVNSVFQIGG